MATLIENTLALPDDSGGYAIMSMDPAELGAVLRENAGAEGISPFELDRAAVPAGGGSLWTVPSLDGDQNLPSIEGIIIHQRLVRSYWSRPMSGGGAPPDCSSQDGLFGVGDPGGECAVCPFAAFGSKVREDGSQGRGQACKQARLLFILRPETVLPMLVTVPPSSLRATKSYLLRLAGQTVPFYGVVTALDLVRERSLDGIVFSRIAPRLVRRLSTDEAAKIRAVHESLLPVLSAVRAVATEDE